MPVATRNVKKKTARAEGLESLINEVSASQPTLPTRKARAPKTPVHKSSQNSLLTPETRRVLPPTSAPAVVAEVVEEEGIETQTQTQTQLPLPQPFDWDKELEETQRDLDEFDRHSLSSLSSEGRAQPPPSAQPVLSVLSLSQAGSSVQPVRKQKKGNAVIRDEEPTWKDLRKVPSRFCLTIDKQTIFTQRWRYHNPFSFEQFEDSVHDLVQKWVDNESHKEDNGIIIRCFEIGRPVGELTAWGIKKPLLFVLSSDITVMSMQREVVGLLEQHKRDIQLEVIWGFKSKRVIQPHSGDEVPTQTVAVGGRKRAHTREDATRRQRRQVEVENAIETATNNFVMETTRRWHCRDRTCKNNRFTCFPLGKVGHLRITTNELTVWNEAIRGDRATVSMPPVEVIATCTERRSKQQGKKVASPSKHSSTPAPTVININAGVGVGNGMLVPELRSSPPAFDGSEVDNLHQYLTWLIQRRHLQGSLGVAARNALAADGWGFQQVRLITEADWVRMAIPRGAQLVILSKQKLWIAAMIEQGIRDAVASSRQANRGDSEVLELSEEKECVMLE